MIEHTHIDNAMTSTTGRPIAMKALLVLTVMVTMGGMAWPAPAAPRRPGEATRSDPRDESSPGSASAAVHSGQSGQSGQNVDATLQHGAKERAIELVLNASRDDDTFIRANSMESAQYLEPTRAVPLLQYGLSDENPIVRFAALAVIGKERIKDLAPAAKALLTDESRSVRAAAIFAVSQCGQRIDKTPLAMYLASRDATLRGNAAMLLGWMGEKSAVRMLKEVGLSPLPRQISRERESVTRLQVTEAMVALGDDEMIDPLRAAAYSDAYEVRILAMQTLGRLGDRKMEQAFLDALAREEEPVELRMAAAEALVSAGSPAALLQVLRQARVVLKASTDTNPLVRTQAAHTLGIMEAGRRRGLNDIQRSGGTERHPADVIAHFENKALAIRLANMLSDNDKQVRLSVAAAVLKAGAAP